MKQIYSPRLISSFLISSVMLFISCSKEPLQPQGKVGTTNEGLQVAPPPPCSTGFYDPNYTHINNGLYFIKSMVNPALNLVLDVPNGTVQNGVIVQQFNYNGGRNQQWWVEALSAGTDYYTISTGPRFGMLDIPNGAPRPGLKVQLYQWNGGLNQQWWIRVKGGYGRIINRQTLLPLGIPNRSTTPGVQIEQSLIYFGNWQFIRVPSYPDPKNPGCSI